VADWSSIRLLFSLVVALGYASSQVDFKNAFLQTKDSCLFVGNNVMLVVHVDNCLIVAPTQAQVDKVILDLCVEGLHLDKEDDIAGYLGIAMDRQANGTIHL
jgi:uncharacterized caspase-like protein